MGRNTQTCSICRSPVLEEINQALLRKEKLRDLEKRSHFSRSALSRHRIKCLGRIAISTNASMRFNPATDRLVQWWEGARPCVACDPTGASRVGDLVTPQTVRDSDMFVKISFEPAPVTAALPQIPAEETPVPPEPGNMLS